MRILGLTGSIGMGKSTAVAMFRRLGVPVHDADAAVHGLMAPRGACFDAVAAAFPDAVADGAVDRGRLGAAVFADAAAKRRLEAILHPAVRAETKRFLQSLARRQAALAVLDIPLLYETGAEHRCDAVAVVTAPEWLQRRRVLARPGMTLEKFDGIRAAQVPDGEKTAPRRRSDPVRTGPRLDLSNHPRNCRNRRIAAAWRLAQGLRRRRSMKGPNGMREIVLDTETTGLDPASGHKIVEIGCIELINHIATDKTYHVYLNPERSMPSEAFAVHGLSDDFLADKPLFADVAGDFLAFIGEDPLVIHNAAFDMGFLNAELAAVGRDPIANHRAIDTVAMARSKYPGQKASLDALCKRFNIDNSHRDLHGALKDSELLALVYLELLGGRQQGLGLAAEAATESNPTAAGDAGPAPGQTDTRRPPRAHAPSADEAARHAAFMEKLSNPLWTRSDAAE